MNYSGLHSQVYEKTVTAKRAFIIPDLTSPYIYFQILFCQNTVKKNCKLVPQVF